MQTPVQNYHQLNNEIQTLCQHQPLLLAVSKTVSIEDMMSLYCEGVRDFGESRPQEIIRKAAEMPSDCRWHLIGQLQKNKIRKILPFLHLIHSVDSEELLMRIESIAAELQLFPKVLFEVNISGEESKSGFTPEQLRCLAPTFSQLHHAQPYGLMTMAPYDADEQQLHAIFGQLRTLRDELQTQHSLKLPELSMGMSNDYRIALAEGSTIVRLGSCLFGERIYNKPI